MGDTNHNKSLLSALIKLANSTGNQLLFSELTRSQKDALIEWNKSTNAVRSIKSGSGYAFVVDSADTLTAHLNMRREMSREDAVLKFGAIPDRALNIASMRNSKIGPYKVQKDTIIHLKTIGKHVVWNNGLYSLDIVPIVEQTGIFSITILEADNWASDHTLCLVENKTLFDCLNWITKTDMRPPCSILYYGGFISNELIEWLAHTPRSPELAIFPDYDGVGLINYVRLKEKCECRIVSITDWVDKIQNFGNSAIWSAAKNFQSFELAYSRIRCLPMDKDVETVIAICEKLKATGCALEQEMVWL